MFEEMIFLFSRGAEPNDGFANPPKPIPDSQTFERNSDVLSVGFQPLSLPAS
jgi:hypothetical protein